MLLDGPAIAHDLGISSSTVREWKRRGLIKVRGTDARRRSVFDYDEVHRVAVRAGLVATVDLSD